jgi:hypothetical protein
MAEIVRSDCKARLGDCLLAHINSLPSMPVIVLRALALLLGRASLLNIVAEVLYHSPSDPMQFGVRVFDTSKACADLWDALPHGASLRYNWCGCKTVTIGALVIIEGI